ncbi:unnamed protein product [Albugo candida]|nr:unnamed protein product [Albugo candida]|eukprot:CCI41385.1 unnamed protein product [Albugo candida]
MCVGLLLLHVTPNCYADSDEKSDPSRTSSTTSTHEDRQRTPPNIPRFKTPQFLNGGPASGAPSSESGNHQVPDPKDYSGPIIQSPPPKSSKKSKLLPSPSSSPTENNNGHHAKTTDSPGKKSRSHGSSPPDPSGSPTPSSNAPNPIPVLEPVHSPESLRKPPPSETPQAVNAPEDPDVSDFSAATGVSDMSAVSPDSTISDTANPEFSEEGGSQHVRKRDVSNSQTLTNPSASEGNDEETTLSPTERDAEDVVFINGSKTERATKLQSQGTGVIAASDNSTDAPSDDSSTGYGSGTSQEKSAGDNKSPYILIIFVVLTGIFIIAIALFCFWRAKRSSRDHRFSESMIDDTKKAYARNHTPLTTHQSSEYVDRHHSVLSNTSKDEDTVLGASYHQHAGNQVHTAQTLRSALKQQDETQSLYGNSHTSMNYELGAMPHLERASEVTSEATSLHQTAPRATYKSDYSDEMIYESSSDIVSNGTKNDSFVSRSSKATSGTRNLKFNGSQATSSVFSMGAKSYITPKVMFLDSQADSLELDENDDNRSNFSSFSDMDEHETKESSMLDTMNSSHYNRSSSINPRIPGSWASTYNSTGKNDVEVDQQSDEYPDDKPQKKIIRQSYEL